MEKARVAVTRIKNLLARNSSSPFQDELPPPSSGGIFYHHHSSLTVNEKPAQYVQFGITPAGKIVSYVDPPVGFLTCSCLQENQDLALPRHFSFVKSLANPAAFTEEHVISSKILLQSLTQSQQLSSEISYLFFRLDGEEPDNLEDLKSHVETYLRRSTQGLDHEYETLYSTMFQATAPALSPVPRKAPGHSRGRSRSRSSSSSSGTATPLQGSAISKRSALQYAVLIFTANGQTLSFTLPCANYISDTVQSQLAKDVAKGIKSRRASCLAIYVIKDVNAGRLRYQVCASTVSKEALSQLPLTYRAQKCDGVTYTVVPLRILLKHELQQTYCKSLAETLINESLYRWFQRVIKLILSESLFFACETCNATFEEKAAAIRHAHKTHGNQISSPDSSDLETEASIKISRSGQFAQGQGFSHQRQVEHHPDNEGQGSSQPRGSDHDRPNDRHHGRQNLPLQDHSGHHHHNDRHNGELSSHHERSGYQASHHHRSHSLTPGNPATGSILSKEIYQPKFLTEVGCTREYEIFWNLKGYSLPPSSDSKRDVNAADDSGPKRKWICPKFPRQMLSLEKLVNYPSLLEEETLAWSKTYRYMFTQETFSSIERVDILAIHAYNDPRRLQASGRSKAFEELRKAAPSLESKSLQTLSEAALENFFFQSRIFILSHHIPVECFPDYVITAQSLGNEIYGRIKETLAGYPEFRSVLRRFSVYLESIIRALLPAQEPYSQCEQRIISEHRVYLLSSNPSIDYTRTKLHADASELLMRSPHYVQTRDSMSVDQKRSHVDGLKTNLLSKIVAETPFEADLYRLVTMDQQYRRLEEIPFQILLDRLQNLILADRRGVANAVGLGSLGSRSRVVRSARGSRPSSRSPQPSPPAATRASPRKSRSRSKSPHTNLQPLCDACSKFNLPEKFCTVNKHCRMKNHQPHFKGDNQFYQAVHSPAEVFVLKDKCPKCLSTGADSDYRWILPHQKKSQPVNQVSIPPSFFNSPYSLHPQSVQDIAKQSQSGNYHLPTHPPHPPPASHQPPPAFGRSSQNPPPGQPPRSFYRANSPRR